MYSNGFETTSKWWQNMYSTSEIGDPEEYQPDTIHREIWAKKILGYFPEGQRLKILDVGTGGGYFARLLTAAGHDVIGIDADENALKLAARRADKEGVHPSFVKMDNHHLTFPEDTFDLVVSRNVVWTLYDPAAALLEWKRVLKPGGRLLYFDANWHLEFYHPEVAAWVRDNEKICREKYGIDMRVCTDDKGFYDKLLLSDVMRPAWDRKTLTEIGFDDIQIEKDISGEVYTEWERCLYAATPFFEISAVKPVKDEKLTQVKEYWNKARDTEIYPREEMRRWADLYGRFLPEGKQLNILDVGTGGGFIACSLASAGHRVTGVDLSDERIKSATEKSEKMGLDISFLCTDAGELPFAENSFDVVVCRNLVWTLYHPELTMQQWLRVLKPGGMILYVDANWFYYLYDSEAASLFDPAVYPYSQTQEYKTCEQSAYDMPLSKEKRPKWDCSALRELGLEEVESWDITDIARTEDEKRTYAFAPLFAVRGLKAEGHNGLNK